MVWVGADVEPRDLYSELPWSRELRVDWRWASRADFRKDGYFAQVKARLVGETDAEYVALMDADVVVARSFDDLLAELDTNPAVAGVIAHISPFLNADSAFGWDELFSRLNLAPPLRRYEHTGWKVVSDREEFRYSPAYFNFGFVLGAAHHLAALGPHFLRFMDALDTIRDVSASGVLQYYKAQIAMTLALHGSGAPVRVLPLRFNFPNDRPFERAYPSELADCRCLHYLRSDEVDRDRDFESTEALERLVGRRGLRPSNELLRSMVATLLLQDEAAALRGSRVHGTPSR